MTYDQWKQLVNTKDDPDYYKHMVQFAPDIINQLVEYKQHIVAAQINIQPNRLSYLIPLLKAIANETV